MEFIDFKVKIQQQFDKMSTGDLFVTGVEKDVLWNTYLDSFPPGTNEIFRERREYDCQCCKQFIRACGNVVSIKDNNLVSIWDVEIGGHFQVVADAMSKLVKSDVIRDVFFHYTKCLGTDFNHQQLDSGQILKWNHFHYQLPTKFVKRKERIGSLLSELRSGKDVFKRAMHEISIESAETVIELIDQKSIYRGEEHKSIVELFIGQKEEFENVPEKERDNYCWQRSLSLGGSARVRNTVIGTLLVDISDGVGLDEAVGKFESKVAPTNYKRPTALITKSMIANAQKKVEELGIEDSLNRRYAVAEDITINNVLFANRDTKKKMKNVFEELQSEAHVNLKKLEKVEQVDIETFVSSILPKAESIELMFENKHINNLVSLVAPVDENSKNIFKWHNNFSWAYNGEVADSMKERVKRAGGNVTGVLRFSIQWNDGDNNQNDFDAHCVEPNGNLISYPKKGQIQPSTGMLDVDIINPGRSVAVENITWTDESRMQQGAYVFRVHNYSHNGGRTGFTAEIEYDGQIYSYSYAKELRQGEMVCVAVIEYSREKGIKFLESLPSTHASKEIWGVSTQQFRKVSMIMNSPNHWDGNKTGNKHYFFMLDECKNPDKARGFFNEFLSEDLRGHRKVFEVLGSKMKCEKSDNQLSGLGFSSTQKNSIYCKVSGSFSRTIKINF